MKQFILLLSAKIPRIAGFYLAERLGIEPRLKASKASVLPLDDLSIKQLKDTSKMVIFQLLK